MPDACDLIEETLGLDYVSDELELSFQAAREIGGAVDQGDDVDPGDIGVAVANQSAPRCGPA